MSFAYQIKISGSGQFVSGPNDLSSTGWILKAHTNNTVIAWIQDHNDSPSITGSALGLYAGDIGYSPYINLKQLDFYVESGSAVILASRDSA